MRWIPLLVLLFPTSAHSQEESWKGKAIILKEGVVPMFSQEPGGPQVFLDNLRHITYKALDDKDGKLLVTQAGVEGFIDKSKMLPMEQALDYFTAAIANNPRVAFYYSRRAAVYRWKGENDKALKDQDETIRLHPQEPAYLNNRGLSYAAQRDYDRAIQDYDDALRIRPDYGLALRNRGMAWNGKKDFDKALRDFNEAMQLDPRDAAALSGRGSALGGKKQYAAALASFERALHIDPHLSSANNSWAWLLATCPDAKFRNGRKAVELARKACEQTGWKSGSVIDTLAAAFAEAGQFEEAVRYQQQALEDKAFAAKNDGGRRRLKLYQEKKAYREE
jgi:tetratricopeptide (TPR) repeat protein